MAAHVAGERLGPVARDPGLADRDGRWCLGGAVAGIYRWARRGEAVRPTFLTTLVLLATVIAMATQVIGDNVARAFSLVGALSVVRFRTVVKDTQDTAFVIFAVVVGMASGADHLVVALVGSPSLVLFRSSCGPGDSLADGIARKSPRPEDRAGGRRSIRNRATRVGLGQTFRLTSVGTARQGSALDLIYRVRLRQGCSPSALVAELKALPGVESVELRREESATSCRSNLHPRCRGPR